MSICILERFIHSDWINNMFSIKSSMHLLICQSSRRAAFEKSFLATNYICLLHIHSSHAALVAKEPNLISRALTQIFPFSAYVRVAHQATHATCTYPKAGRQHGSIPPYSVHELETRTRKMRHGAKLHFSPPACMTACCRRNGERPKSAFGRHVL